ncbi:unnamed protein product [Brassica oleracea var. botrytis]
MRNFESIGVVIIFDVPFIVFHMRRFTLVPPCSFPSSSDPPSPDLPSPVFTSTLIQMVVTIIRFVVISDPPEPFWSVSNTLIGSGSRYGRKCSETRVNLYTCWLALPSYGPYRLN